MTGDEAHRALLAAHADGDAAALVRGYRAEAEAREARGDIDGACFYYTQAYVFALQSGHPAAQALHEALKAHGRND